MTAITTNIDRVVRAQRSRFDGRVRLVDRTIDLVDGGRLGTVPEFARAADVSVRTLQRAFHENIGIDLRWLVSRQRVLLLERLHRLDGQQDWNALAAEFGFSDWPHLSRMFKRFVGQPPASYARRHIRMRLGARTGD